VRRAALPVQRAAGRARVIWRNWSGEQACSPAEVVRPRSTEEVAAAVQRARDAGRVVRVAGAGHSFTSAVLTAGVLLSLDAMDRVVWADPGGRRVRVQAGIRLHALSEALARRGLALENMGDVDAQSIAGATATGTHGSGVELRNLSAAIEAVQIVAGDGSVREIDGGDALRAARISVGALGVVTELTLRCVPAFVMRGVDAPAPLDDVLDRLDELADGARHFEFYAFPHSDTVLTRTNRVVTAPAQPPGRARRWAEDVLLANHGLHLACGLARRRPRWIPSISRAMTSALSERTRIDRSDRIFVSPRRVRFTEMEQAFPRAAARDALRAILAEVRRHPVIFPIELRFVAPDDALLSPAHGRDTVYIAVHNYVGMPWEPYFRAVAAIGAEHGARPHWGKRHFHTAATLAPLYPEWERFQAVRAELDPEGRFTNAYVERVLGPPAAR
jgi:L-gulonolactone oxidase